MRSKRICIVSDVLHFVTWSCYPLHIIVKCALIFTVVIPYSTGRRLFHFPHVVKKTQHPRSLSTSTGYCYNASKWALQHTRHIMVMVMLLILQFLASVISSEWVS